MIYQRKFDLVLLGSHYFSYLYGLRALALGQSVCIIDDNRFQLSDTYRGDLDLLQKSFLLDWGKDRLIPELIEIDRNLLASPFMLEFDFNKDHKSLFLGRSPSENLNELLRKMWDYFDPKTLELLSALRADANNNEEQENLDQNFNQAYTQKIQALSRLLFYQKNNYSLTLEDLHGALLPQMQSLAEHWGAALRSKEEHLHPWIQKLRVFIFLLAQHFQFKFNREVPQFELIILILRMLSPCYKINLEKFESALKHEFLVWNGSYKQTQIKHVDEGEDSIQSLEIDSFEGILRPRRVMVMTDQLSDNLPLVLQKQPLDSGKLFRAIRIDLQRFTPYYRAAGELKGLYFSNELSHLETYFLKYQLGDTPQLIFYIKANLAQRPVHFLKIAQALLLQFSSQKFQATQYEALVLRESDLSWAQEVSLQDDFKSSGRYPNVRRAKLPLAINSIYGGKRSKLQRADYLGPINCGSLGALTGLMELHNCDYLHGPEKTSGLDFGPGLD